MSTPSLRIEERIRSILRSDYDTMPHPDLPERQLPPQMAFFRLTELARFWEDPQTGGESLLDRQQRLITSLHGSIPWAYLISGEGGAASIYIGVPCQAGQGHGWEQHLTAQFPGSSWQMEMDSQHLLATLTGFPVVASISGNPSVAPSDDQQTGRGHASAGLESLFDTMAGVRWAYIVLARPLSDQEVANDVQQTESELQETISAFRRPDSAEEHNNPLVDRYLTLLESGYQKLLQGQRNGMWDVQSYLLTESVGGIERGTRALHAVFGGPGSEPQPFRVKAGNRHSIRGTGFRMTTRLNSSEVAVLSSLPRREVAGVQMIHHASFGMSTGMSGNDGVALGTIMSGGTRTSRWYELPQEDFCKHAFIAGVPGAGKTRTCFYILFQLWFERRIPWLVLEPSLKREYRVLLHSAFGPDLRVLTAGDETVSPLRLNPLEVQKGVKVQTHIGEVATIFKAAFVMEAPMPQVLDEALHRVYAERGWNFDSGTHPSYTPECQPTLGDLLETCTRVVLDLKHEEKVKANILGALTTRIGSLMRGAKGRMLNVRQSIPMDFLLSAPTVIEFATIGDDDEKAFILGCILMKLSQYWQVEGLSPVGLRHITLIEEAHRLLRHAPDTAGSAAANPRRQAVEYFSHMLAEMRAHGAGLVAVEQMPSKLVKDVIHNSGLKIIHRLTAEEERRLVGGAMALDEAQIRFLATLSPGQAIVYSDASVNACRISVPDHAGNEGYLANYPSDAELRDSMRGRIPAPLAPDDAAQQAVERLIPANEDNAARCITDCRPVGCTTRTTIERYIREHLTALQAAFSRAMVDGFEALWQLGKGVSVDIGRSGPGSNAVAFCAVLAIATRMGMNERNLTVVRNNMRRLWDMHEPGARS